MPQSPACQDRTISQPSSGLADWACLDMLLGSIAQSREPVSPPSVAILEFHPCATWYHLAVWSSMHHLAPSSSGWSWTLNIGCVLMCFRPDQVNGSRYGRKATRFQLAGGYLHCFGYLINVSYFCAIWSTRYPRKIKDQQYCVYFFQRAMNEFVQNLAYRVCRGRSRLWACDKCVGIHLRHFNFVENKIFPFPWKQELPLTQFWRYYAICDKNIYIVHETASCRIQTCTCIVNILSLLNISGNKLIKKRTTT